MKLRTREWNSGFNTHNYTCQVIVGAGPSYRDENREYLTGTARHSLITDEAWEKAGNKGAYCPTKVCTHLSSAIIPQTWSDEIVMFRTAGDLEVWPLKFGDIFKQILTAPQFISSCPSLEKPLISISERIITDTEDANRIGWMKFRDPTLDRGFSLINFLLELNEVGLLLRQMKALRAWLRRLRSDPIYLSDLGQGATWGTIMGGIARGSLAFAFGILPLIGDLQKIWSILSRMDRDIKRLNDLKDKGLYQTLTSRMYGWNDVVINDDVPADYVPVSNGGNGPACTVALDFGLTAEVYVEHFWTESNHASQKVGAWARHGVGYSYSLPEAKHRYARMLQFLDAFGVNTDLSIVWNRCPWTFVIDWVCKVASFLHETRKPWFPIDVTLSDCMVSHRVKLARKVYVVLKASGGASVDGFESVQKELFHDWACIYDRRRVKPYIGEREVGLDSAAVKLRHLWLGGSLAVANSGRVRKTVARVNASAKKRFWRCLLRANKYEWALKRTLKRFAIQYQPVTGLVRIPDGF